MTLPSYSFKTYSYFLFCGLFWLTQPSFGASGIDDVFSSPPSSPLRPLAETSSIDPEQEVDRFIERWKKRTSTSTLTGTSGACTDWRIIVSDLAKLIASVKYASDSKSMSEEVQLQTQKDAQKEAAAQYRRIRDSCTSIEATIEALRPTLAELLQERNASRKRRTGSSRLSPP